MLEKKISKQDQIEQCWKEFESFKPASAPTGREFEQLFESALKEIQSSSKSSNHNQLRLNVEELMAG